MCFFFVNIWISFLYRLYNLSFLRTTLKNILEVATSEKCLQLNNYLGVVTCFLEPRYYWAWYLTDLFGRRNTIPIAYPESTRK